MAPVGEPDWATPGNTSVNADVNDNLGTSSVNTGGANGNHAKLWISLLSFLNMGLAAAMGALGILTLIDLKGNPFKENMTVFFLSIYMTMFATILFSYEVMWWQPSAFLNKMYRKNFGFMYGIQGKGLYLIFVAFLTIGLRDETKDHTAIPGLNWAVFFGWLVAGLIHEWLACTNMDVVLAYKPPTAGLTTPADDSPVV